MLILLGSVDSNFLISIFQASLATSVSSMVVWSSGEIHNRIWLYAVSLWSVHSLISCASGVLPMHCMPPTVTTLGSLAVGKISLLRMLV